MNTQTEIRDAIRNRCAVLGLSMWATESCVKLGVVFDVLGRDKADCIARACEVATVMADEVRLAEKAA